VDRSHGLISYFDDGYEEYCTVYLCQHIPLVQTCHIHNCVSHVTSQS